MSTQPSPSFHVEYIDRPLWGRHWLILLAAVALSFAALISMISVNGPFLVAWTKPERMMLNRADHYGFQGARVQLRTPEVTSADAIIMGSSTAIESHWPPVELEAAYRLRTGRSYHWLNLALPEGSFIEQLLLLSNTPLHRGQIVLLFTGPSRYRYQSLVEGVDRIFQKQSLLISPRHFLEEYRANFPDLLTNRRYSLWDDYKLARGITRRYITGTSRAFFNLASGYTEEPFDPYYFNATSANGMREILPTLIAEQERRFGDLAVTFEEHLPEVERALTKLVQCAKERQVRIVLLESPLAPKTREIAADIYDRYRDSIAKIAATEGVPYVDLNSRAELAAEDFIDYHHPNRIGQAKWSLALISWLAEFNQHPIKSATQEIPAHAEGES